MHSWKIIDDYDNIIAGKDVPKNDELHDLFLDFYPTVDITNDFYWFTLQKASADDMYPMNNKELKQFDLIDFEVF